MRNLSAALALIATIGLGHTLAVANEITMHKYTVEEIKSACDKVGGKFSQDTTGYACGTDCHGAPGTDCVVDCKSGQSCVAQFIGRKRPANLLSALQAPGHSTH